MSTMLRRVLRLTGRAVAAIVLASMAVGLVLMALVHQAGTVDDAAPSDVIIVLGAALSRDGTPYRALTRRSEHAAWLWRNGQAPAVICTGGFGDDVRVRRSEADGCREVLLREGVPAESIVLEEESRNTRENLHIARRLMTARGWRTAILVSDSYHMYRASRFAREAGLDMRPSPVPRARIGSPLFYGMSVAREVLALFKP